MNGFYPVFLQLKGRRCLIIGGGRIAERKLLGLLNAGADDVWIISPDVTPRIAALAAEGTIHCCLRAYEAGDLEGTRLLFAATNDKRLNTEAAAAAERMGIWANTADEAGKGSFISPSTLRRGDLLFAVTASGASPALSQHIKQELEAYYGAEYEEISTALRRLRERVVGEVEDEQKRQNILKLAAEDAARYKRYDRNIDEWLISLLHRTDRRHT
ncbi:precorrin-2 dehydrogenase/sirohydrochlorin ferrochelatase [Paenibacillus endophyticus]|uniref:precorrin-2 dehydrogenase n=1 Tax=Paenibacillus endophyticus TaxID=1294268 RepID=A0A7W5C2R4_9BACL|nr:bifunctional precorrin-2 dehydrogenase/sirohydrochlorin ferrochelatase [Paenibacillus endophyticus]MBB3150167.1 precorrin-2 dehydrogenase/sirohydrochlorin ferrochelatase [Paenibacillus endophyticus]